MIKVKRIDDLKVKIKSISSYVQGKFGHRPFGPKEIDEQAKLLRYLLTYLLTILLLVNRSGLNLPSQTIHTYKPLWLPWKVMLEAFFDVMTALFWVPYLHIQ